MDALTGKPKQNENESTGKQENTQRRVSTSRRRGMWKETIYY